MNVCSPASVAAEQGNSGGCWWRCQDPGAASCSQSCGLGRKCAQCPQWCENGPDAESTAEGDLQYQRIRLLFRLIYHSDTTRCRLQYQVGTCWYQNNIIKVSILVSLRYTDVSNGGRAWLPPVQTSLITHYTTNKMTGWRKIDVLISGTQLPVGEKLNQLILPNSFRVTTVYIYF